MLSCVVSPGDQEPFAAAREDPHSPRPGRDPQVQEVPAGQDPANRQAARAPGEGQVRYRTLLLIHPLDQPVLDHRLPQTMTHIINPSLYASTDSESLLSTAALLPTPSPSPGSPGTSTAGSSPFA